MNCTDCQARMVEFTDGRLGAADQAAVRTHLDGCAQCRAEWEALSGTLAALDALRPEPPSHRLRARVAGLIETEKLALPRESQGAAGKARPDRDAGSRPRWAHLLAQVLGACVLVALGFFLGERNATGRQLADLRARVDTMGQLVEQSVLQTQPTGARLETVLTAGSANRPDERVIDGLINSMAFDPSVNVRLNALNALYAHSGQEVVRAGVLACLPREANPLVQISMIDFLVAAKAREASPELGKIVADPNADTDVRDSARRAIELL